MEDHFGEVVRKTTPGGKVALIANLLALTLPRYASLPASALGGYLVLMTTLMNALPVGSLDPPKARSSSEVQSSV